MDLAAEHVLVADHADERVVVGQRCDVGAAGENAGGLVFGVAELFPQVGDLPFDLVDDDGQGAADLAFEVDGVGVGGWGIDCLPLR